MGSIKNRALSRIFFFLLGCALLRFGGSHSPLDAEAVCDQPTERAEREMENVPQSDRKGDLQIDRDLLGEKIGVNVHVAPLQSPNVRDLIEQSEDVSHRLDGNAVRDRRFRCLVASDDDVDACNVDPEMPEKAGEEEREDLFDEIEVAYRCDCSEDRMARGICSLPEGDIEDLFKEEKSIEAVCHFCGKKYLFSQEKVRALRKK